MILKSVILLNLLNLLKQNKNLNHNNVITSRKISNLVKETLGLIFLQKVKDPGLGFITILRAKVSPDLKIANIYISVYEKEKREYVMKHIESIKGFLRSELAKRVNLRITPELNFFLDDTQDYVDKMNEILNSLKNADKERNEEN
ncbi:MAG: 30S ribosome-binding factor RbfA [Ignavibacteriae bacterium]|nr:30S ribosome-binding factor RbfA [Ignavibacteriota bacterium]